MATIQAAPGELELVREFVNTNDFDEGIELLTSPAKLGEWLAAHGLEVDRALKPHDLDRAVELREALRACCSQTPASRWIPTPLNDSTSRLSASGCWCASMTTAARASIPKREASNVRWERSWR